MKAESLNDLGPLREVRVNVSLAEGFALYDIDEEDHEALGVHVFLIPESLDDSVAASLAMGMLHWTVPIENVGVLSYEVTDGTRVLVPDRSVDWSELAFKYEGVLWERRRWDLDETGEHTDGRAAATRSPRASLLLAKLGSTFVKCAFLGALGDSLASELYAGVHTASYAGTVDGYSHGALAAKPLASALSSAHDVCAEFTVVDQDSLADMLEAIEGLLDGIRSEGNWDWSSHDEAWARPRLEHAFKLASLKATEALAEVNSGFAISGGDLGVWRQELMHREAMAGSVTWSQKG